MALIPNGLSICPKSSRCYEREPFNIYFSKDDLATLIEAAGRTRPPNICEFWAKSMLKHIEGNKMAQIKFWKETYLNGFVMSNVQDGILKGQMWW